MKIDPSKNLISNLDPRTQSTDKSELQSGKVQKRETPQGDRVDISINRKIINVNDLSSEAAQATSEQLDADRIAEIRQRVQSGFYGTDTALRGAADGILELFSS